VHLLVRYIIYILQLAITEMYPRIPLGSAQHYGNQCLIVFCTPCSKDSCSPWRRPPFNLPAICLTQHISVWQQGFKTSICNNPLTEATDKRQRSKHNNNRRPPVITPPFSQTQGTHHHYTWTHKNRIATQSTRRTSRAVWSPLVKAESCCTPGMDLDPQ
jgi:hypothetical protein